MQTVERAWKTVHQTRVRVAAALQPVPGSVAVATSLATRRSLVLVSLMCASFTRGQSQPQRGKIQQSDYGLWKFFCVRSTADRWPIATAQKVKTLKMHQHDGLRWQRAGRDLIGRSRHCIARNASRNLSLLRDNNQGIFRLPIQRIDSLELAIEHVYWSFHSDISSVHSLDWRVFILATSSAVADLSQISNFNSSAAELSWLYSRKC